MSRSRCSTTRPTVILGLVHFLLPFMVLNVFVSLDGIDVTLEDAACSLGATRWQSLHGGDAAAVAAGPGGRRAALLRARAGTYITPLVLGGPTDAMFANLVFEAIITQLNWPLGSALSLMLLAVLGALVLIYNHYLGMAS
jgi:spermidine/putrescine transport system permease protein